MNERLPKEAPQADLLGGRYKITSPLGAGGMGEVFLAEDILLERRVAIKVLPADVQTDSVARERLRREALAAAALDHPFICKVHEIGEADGRLFIVMEYVEGETLHVLARRSLVPMRQVVEMANELAEALEVAHQDKRAEATARSDANGGKAGSRSSAASRAWGRPDWRGS